MKSRDDQSHGHSSINSRRVPTATRRSSPDAADSPKDGGVARVEQPRTRGLALRLGLADIPTEEAYTRVLRAVDEGTVTISEGLRLTEIVGRALPLRDAAEFRRRLAGAEAAHRAALEATRQLGSRAAPASARTVEAPPLEHLPVAAGDRS